jgi:acyl-CoA thioesterase FadM
MARIKIKLPDPFLFETNLPIRISDINYGNHLGHDAVLSIIHEARVRFLAHLGYTELDIHGSGVILADAAIVYKSEGFYGDVLNIAIAVGDFTKFGCDLFYRLTNQSTAKEVARAKTGMVFFDYETKKLVRVPEVFKSTIAAQPNQSKASNQRIDAKPLR